MSISSKSISSNSIKEFSKLNIVIDKSKTTLRNIKNESNKIAKEKVQQNEVTLLDIFYSRKK